MAGFLPGLMQHHPLLISSILTHAARHHGEAELVSRRADGSLDRTTYAALAGRSLRLAGVLRDLGVEPGARVATLAMNSDRHFELYYAVAGIGAVCHTVNPRLTPADIAYILDEAEDGVIFADPAYLPLVAAVAPSLTRTLRAVVVMGAADEMAPCALPVPIALYCYETLMAAATPLAAWPSFDENAASALCYTSGTTGHPKGVLYSHRSTLLHAMAMNFADAVGARATDRIALAVPMFHVNAWCTPYMAPMAGASLLMPGRHLDPASFLSLLNGERASFGLGVPTVWQSLYNHLRDTGARLESLKRILVGGAAMPRALIAAYNDMGIRVQCAWGMTESSPGVTINAPKPACFKLEGEAQWARKAAAGRCMYGVDVRAVDDDETEVPHDGVTAGHLRFRGHWIASGYFKRSDGAPAGGWFPTGDVGVIDGDGFVALTDRTKDLIKSGGEWISSIAIENAAAGHPDVAEAAAIAVPHEKWGERPLLIVVPRTGTAPTPEDLREFCRGKMTDWSIPDRVVIVDTIPHGATGKVLKTELRKMYGGMG